MKSLQGERLESASFTAGGVEGDRAYAIYDLDTGLGLTARRVPELLFASASILDGDRLRITLPDGTEGADDDALSAWLDRRVELRSAEAQNPRRYENPVDFEHDEPESAWAPFEGAEGAFHDSARVRVSMVSKATIGDWDRRRFRSNLLLEGEGEDALRRTFGDDRGRRARRGHANRALCDDHAGPTRRARARRRCDAHPRPRARRLPRRGSARIPARDRERGRWGYDHRGPTQEVSDGRETT